jgi:hypothetical protein
MTPEVSTEVESIFKKFSALKTVVCKRAGLIQFLDRHEANFRLQIEHYGPKKTLLRGMNRELEVWVRDLFKGDEKERGFAALGVSGKKGTSRKSLGPQHRLINLK